MSAASTTRASLLSSSSKRSSAPESARMHTATGRSPANCDDLRSEPDPVRRKQKGEGHQAGCAVLIWLPTWAGSAQVGSSDRRVVPTFAQIRGT